MVRPASSDDAADLIWSAHATGHGPYLVRGSLAKGLRVAIRPLRATDSGELTAGLDQLSERSRYLRFLEPKQTLNARDLKVLVSSADQQQHIALALVWPRTSCEDVFLGVAHAFRLPGHPDTADAAIIVTDQIQGQGAGRLLITALADAARDRGVTHFTAVLLASNAASARLLASLGPIEQDETSAGLRELTVRLCADRTA